MIGQEAIQDNLYGLYGALAAAGLVGSGTAGGFDFVRHAGSAWPNMAYPGQTGAGADIGALVAAVRAGECPRLVVIEEAQLAEGVGRQMNGARLVPAAQWINMTMPVAADVPDMQSPALSCRIVDASQPGDWRGWSGVVEETLFKKAPLAKELFQGGQEKGIFQLIAGYYEGRAVCSSLIYFGRLAGIYMVATLPGYQGKGFGRELMRFTASAARSRGYGSVVLHSTARGLGLYGALGFEQRGKLLLYYCMS